MPRMETPLGSGSTATNAASHHCTRCGAPGPFRSEQALKCVECDDVTAKERAAYHRLYHRARGEAIKRLIDAHRREFSRYMMEEREKLEGEG